MSLESKLAEFGFLVDTSELESFADSTDYLIGKFQELDPICVAYDVRTFQDHGLP